MHYHYVLTHAININECFIHLDSVTFIDWDFVGLDPEPLDIAATLVRDICQSLGGKRQSGVKLYLS